MKSSKLPKIPELPLSKAARLKGVVRLVQKRETKIGQVMAEIMQFETDVADEYAFAEVLTRKPTATTFSMNNGELHFLSSSGSPVSLDQLLELDALMQAFPLANLDCVFQERTYSFSIGGNDELESFLKTCRLLHVYGLVTSMKQRAAQEDMKFTTSVYEVEFVTSSRISMLYKVMKKAGLISPVSYGEETLRPCPAELNSFVCDQDAPLRHIEAEEAEIRQAISKATASKILSAMHTSDSTDFEESSAKGAL